MADGLFVYDYCPAMPGFGRFFPCPFSPAPASLEWSCPLRSTYLNATALLHKYTDSSRLTVLVEWRMGGSQHADHTSGHSSFVESRQSAEVATQQKLGLLSERRARLGSNCAAGVVASWESLKALAPA